MIEDLTHTHLHAHNPLIIHTGVQAHLTHAQKSFQELCNVVKVSMIDQGPIITMMRKVIVGTIHTEINTKTIVIDQDHLIEVESWNQVRRSLRREALHQW